MGYETKRCEMKTFFRYFVGIALVLDASIHAMEKTMTALPSTQSSPVEVAASSSAQSAKKEWLLDKSIVRLQNKTRDTLLVRTKRKDVNSCMESTLIPEQFIDFSQVDTLELMQVKPYGVYKGWLSAETLHKQPYNLVDYVKSESKRLQSPSVKLEVHPSWDSSKSGILAYPMAFMCEKFLPYAYVCDYFEQLDEYHFLDQVFPQLARAAGDLRIDPRLALNVGIQSQTAENILLNFNHLMMQWAGKESSADVETRRLAQDVRAIASAAANAINNSERMVAFGELVRTNFILHAPRYNVTPDAAPLLSEFLEERGRAVREASQCAGAVKAFRDLIDSWPRFAAFMRSKSATHAAILRLCAKVSTALKQSDAVRVAFMLGTPEARAWVCEKISGRYVAPWVAFGDFDAVYVILEGYITNPYNQPIVDELLKNAKHLLVLDADGNNLLMRALMNEHFDLAFFLLKQSICCTTANHRGKLPDQLLQEKIQDRRLASSPQIISKLLEIKEQFEKQQYQMRYAHNATKFSGEF